MCSVYSYIEGCVPKRARDEPLCSPARATNVQYRHTNTVYVLYSCDRAVRGKALSLGQEDAEAERKFREQRRRHRSLHASGAAA